MNDVYKCLKIVSCGTPENEIVKYNFGCMTKSIWCLNSSDGVWNIIKKEVLNFADAWLEKWTFVAIQKNTSIDESVTKREVLNFMEARTNEWTSVAPIRDRQVLLFMTLYLNDEHSDEWTNAIAFQTTKNSENCEAANTQVLSYPNALPDACAIALAIWNVKLNSRKKNIYLQTQLFVWIKEKNWVLTFYLLNGQNNCFSESKKKNLVQTFYLSMDKGKDTDLTI